jgi:hypothetical protein
MKAAFGAYAENAVQNAKFDLQSCAAIFRPRLLFCEKVVSRMFPRMETTKCTHCVYDAMQQHCVARLCDDRLRRVALAGCIGGFRWRVSEAGLEVESPNITLSGCMLTRYPSAMNASQYCWSGTFWMAAVVCRVGFGCYLTRLNRSGVACFRAETPMLIN